MKFLNLRFIPISILLLMISFTASGEDFSKKRDLAYQYYQIENYLQASAILNELISADSTAFFWMDFALLANIYLKMEKPDSAKFVIALATEKTRKSTDPRLLKRNQEIFDDLTFQLNHQPEILIFPRFFPLDHYLEAKSDSSKSDSSRSDRLNLKSGN